MAPIASRMSYRYSLYSPGIDCFPLDDLFQSRLDRAREYQIDRTGKQSLQEELQIHVCIKALSLEVDDEIKVT